MALKICQDNEPNDDFDDFDEKPLDKLTKEILKNGIKKNVPALSQGWAEKVIYIHYTPPEDISMGKITPEDLVAANEEWMDRMNLLKADMKFLLQLPHHRFWSQFVFDQELRHCLSSFLSHCPRYFDPPNPNLTDEMKKVIEEIGRDVFFIHLRLATYKENKSCHITPSVFGEMIYDNYLFDIPKLMDLCVIYSNGNSNLLQKIIENIFKYQPKYYDDLASVIPSIKQAFENAKLTIGLGDLDEDLLLKNGHFSDKLSEISWLQLQDGIRFLVDISATLSAFLEVYHLASNVFNEDDFPNFLASYYELVIPLIQRELRLRAKDEKSVVLINPMKSRIILVKKCCIKIVRTIITVAYIEPILESSEEEPKMNYIDSFLDFMICRLSEPSFVADYIKEYPIEDDLDMIAQMGTFHDQMKVDYLLQGVRLLESGKDKKKIGSVMKNGINAKQMQTSENKGQEMNGFSEGACASEAITGVELQSLISQVKDLLPDLGDGFVGACLEYYNYSVENVIHCLLENNLPTQLAKLDRNMQLKEKVENSNANSNEKSKENSSILSERKNVFDNDEFDLFNRSDVDVSRIHKGKRTENKSEKAILDDKTELKSLKNFYKTYENVVDVMSNTVIDDDLYNDEYDDTYDENDVGALIENSFTQDELLLRRPFTTPRVLAPKVEKVYETYNDEEANTSNVNKDHFVQNPEEIRQRNAERWASKQQRGRWNRNPPPNRDVTGNPKGHGQTDEVKRNRLFKERNKSKGGDHNRRHFADRKRSGGMFPR